MLQFDALLFQIAARYLQRSDRSAELGDKWTGPSVDDQASADYTPETIYKKNPVAVALSNQSQITLVGKYMCLKWI